VTVAAGAISQGTAALALFGAEDANGTQHGLFEQANGGTLFLDEVADLDPELQLRLSSVIERRELIRCGGHEPVTLDARVIAASGHDLAALVAAGRFREELYYQLKIVPLAVPPLRERGDDIPELLRYHADWFANRDQLPYRNFPVAVQNRLRHYAWPGNLRELRHEMQRATVLAGDRRELQPEDLSFTGSELPRSPAPGATTLQQKVEALERREIEEALRRCNANRTHTAEALGLSRQGLLKKLERYGLT